MHGWSWSAGSGLQAWRWAAAAPRFLIGAVSGLVALGLVVLGSASSVRAMDLTGDPFFFVWRQLRWLSLGLVVAVVTAHVPYRWWRHLVWPLTAVSVAVLVLVLVYGRHISGSQRWLWGFQGAELGKFTCIVLLATWIARVPLQMDNPLQGLVIPGCMLGVFLVLILLEPDVGTTALLAGVAWLMLLAHGAPARWLIPVAIVGLGLLFLYVRLDPLRWERVLAWWDPEHHPRVAYQILEAKRAFLMGGAFGVGPGNSGQKHYRLPEAQTDFILALVGEEYGLLGCLLVVFLFAVFTASGVLISLHAWDQFGLCLGSGLTFLVTLQALFNVAVATGLVPTKGVGLPFMSYGGSNLVMLCASCGILVNIARGRARWRERVP